MNQWKIFIKTINIMGKRCFLYFLGILTHFFKNNWINNPAITIPAAIRGFNIAIPTRSRIAKIHKTTFNIISPYQITKDCNIKPKKSLTKI